MGLWAQLIEGVGVNLEPLTTVLCCAVVMGVLSPSLRHVVYDHEGD